MSADPGAQWALVVRRGGGVAALRLERGAIIGSDGDCDLVLKGRGVAGRHARVRLRDGRPELSGVRLGEREHRLRVGDADLAVHCAASGDVVWFGGTPALVVRYERRGKKPWLTVCCAEAGNGTPSPRLSSGDPKTWAVWLQLGMAATAAWPILLLGESGTGKEVAARLCHERSARRHGPFVAINCAALPHNLVESELFGSARGAFTGASTQRDGAFVRAHGGTLLLDEVGELPFAAQAALLRVLESGEVQVVGGDVCTVDVRIIAATHVDLFAASQQRTFRLDLLHRLAVITAELPAVRERPGDAAVLLQEWLGAPLPRATAALINDQQWRGNVRELRNLARRLRILSPDGVVTRAQLLATLQASRGGRPAVQPSTAVLDRSDRISAVRDALREHSTVSAAMRATGLPRSTFFRYVAKARAIAARERELARSSGLFDESLRAVSVNPNPWSASQSMPAMA